MAKNNPPAEPAAEAPAPASLTWGEAVPAPDPFAHVGDSSWGKGGSYIIDPETGARVPAPADQQ